MCEKNTYTNLNGSSQCYPCQQCEFGEFLYFQCSTVSNTDCRPYQYDIPPTEKIIVACLPAILLIIALGVFSALYAFQVIEKIDWNLVWESSLGANDMCSNWMLLLLIEPANPWMIFWVVWISLTLSAVASLAFAIWFVNKKGLNPCENSAFSAYILWLCLTSSTNTLNEDGQDDRSKDLVKKLNRLNYISILLLGTLPMTIVQIILYSTTPFGTQVLDIIIIAEVMLWKVFFCT
jgi:hypothetical protein